MKTVILSDCHGQPHLITNVLEHVKGWDRLIFLGDILDIGNQALECLDILKENSAELLWGNHDLAVVLDKAIWPQSPYDQEARDAIVSHQKEFKVATYVDDVLLTHAGLSQNFYGRWFENDIKTTKEISNYLNGLNLLSDMWHDQSPIWYRPSKHYLPKVGLRQVVGHTPPGWIEYNGLKFDDFISVDPYCKHGFNSKRYRYVIIEEGNIRLVDSKGYK